MGSYTFGSASLTSFPPENLRGVSRKLRLLTEFATQTSRGSYGGVPPLEGVAENREAGCSEGQAPLRQAQGPRVSAQGPQVFGSGPLVYLFSLSFFCSLVLFAGKHYVGKNTKDKCTGYCTDLNCAKGNDHAAYTCNKDD